MALQELFVQYLTDVPSLRENCLDCDNITFHKENELRIKVPKEWDAAASVVNATKQSETLASSVLIFYSDTPCYKSIQEMTDDDPVKFCSFFELQCSIMDAVVDIRHQKRITEQIKETGVVIVFDAGRCSPVVQDAIRQFANGALIFID